MPSFVSSAFGRSADERRGRPVTTTLSPAFSVSHPGGRHRASCQWRACLRSAHLTRTKCQMKRRMDEHLPSTRTTATAIGARAIGAQAIGAQGIGGLAIGALAVGAVAIGTLALGRLIIGRLAIRRTRLGVVEIDELRVGRLRVQELVVDDRR